MDWDSFLEVHKGLLRQGPGTEADVAWAVSLADMAGAATICDAACGAGADIAALLKAAPEARITAIDKLPVFVATAREAFSNEPRVTVSEGDIAALPGPFDMIWCAGALYFLGLKDGLAAMKAQLSPGGVLAFSEPCFFVDDPSDDAVAFWDGHNTQSQNTILEAVCAGGFDIVGHRPVSDDGWEGYFQPMESRIAQMRPGATAQLSETLDACSAEAALWRRVKAETGYLLVVARAA